MNDKGISVLEHYDLKVLRTYRGRGAIICETNQGLKVLRELCSSARKVELQEQLLSHMKQMGINRVDSYVKNREGTFITKDRDGTSYTLKDWFEGRECDVKNPLEIEKLSENLALIHKAMQMPDEAIFDTLEIYDLTLEFEKHTKELSRVRRFVKEKGQKTEFEVCFMKYFPRFFVCAEEVLTEICSFDKKTYMNEVRKQGYICHGDYNYHNVIMEKQGMATINFEKFCFDMQVRDLYQFLRKILEKNDWNLEIGISAINIYEKVRPLKEIEKKNLILRLSYPEKFWKIANHYYNSSKAWIPEKNVHKLEKLVEQEENKQKFIEKLKVLYYA